MKDLIPYAAEILAPTGAQIELSYNDISAEIPLIVLSEINNIAEIITEDTEQFSSISIQIDIYHFTEEKARNLGINVSDIMTKAGFRRSSSQMITENELKRYMLQFDCGIDNNDRIYCGTNNI